TIHIPFTGLFIKPHGVHLTIKDSTLALFTIDILASLNNPPRAIVTRNNHVVRRHDTHDNIRFTLAPRGYGNKRSAENKRIKMSSGRRNIQVVRLEYQVKLFRIPALEV